MISRMYVFTGSLPHRQVIFAISMTGNVLPSGIETLFAVLPVGGVYPENCETVLLPVK
jgi:hypothetical protein